MVGGTVPPTGVGFLDVLATGSLGSKSQSAFSVSHKISLNMWRWWRELASHQTWVTIPVKRDILASRFGFI